MLKSLEIFLEEFQEKCVQDTTRIPKRMQKGAAEKNPGEITEKKKLLVDFL